MASTVYTNYKGLAMQGTLDLLTANLYCALLTSSYTPNQDTDTYWGDIQANESSGSGYTAGGVAMASPTVTADNTNHRYLFDAANVQWANSTIANARYAAIYNNTGTAGTSQLVALIDLGTTQSTSGTTFSINWSTSPAGIFYLA